MKHSILLNNIESWHQFKKENHNLNEVIIFKFSPICSQSLDVQQEVMEWYEDTEISQSVILASVDVIGSRELSRLIAAETGIKHESPQIIWFDKNGEVKFTASHRKINLESLSECI